MKDFFLTFSFFFILAPRGLLGLVQDLVDVVLLARQRLPPLLLGRLPAGHGDPAAQPLALGLDQGAALHRLQDVLLDAAVVVLHVDGPVQGDGLLDGAAGRPLPEKRYKG